MDKCTHEVRKQYLSIPAPIEPPDRSLRATIPAAQSHYSGGGNHHSGNQETTIPAQGNQHSGLVETITQIPYTVVMHRLV